MLNQSAKVTKMATRRPLSRDDPPKPRMWSTKKMIWIAVGSFMLGAVMCGWVGFKQLNWVSASDAKALVTAAQTEVEVKHLTPQCVAAFLAQEDAQNALANLQGQSSSWQRRQLIQRGTWFPEGVDSGLRAAVAEPCAEQLFQTEAPHRASEVEQTSG